MVLKIFSPCIQDYPDPETSSRNDIENWVQSRLTANYEINTLLESVSQKLLSVDPLFVLGKRTESCSRFSQLAQRVYYSFMRVIAGEGKIQKWIAMYCYLESERIRRVGISSSNVVPAQVESHEDTSVVPVLVESDEDTSDEGFQDCIDDGTVPVTDPSSLQPLYSAQAESDGEFSEEEAFYDCESSEDEDLRVTEPLSVTSIPTAIVIQAATPKEKLKRLFVDVLGASGGLFVQYALPEIEKLEINDSAFTLSFNSAYTGTIKKIKHNDPLELPSISLWVEKQISGTIDLSSNTISFQGGIKAYFTKVPGSLISLKKDNDSSLVIKGYSLLTKIEKTLTLAKLAEGLQRFSISWAEYQPSWLW